MKKKNKSKKINLIKEKIIHEPFRAEGVVSNRNIYADYPFKCKKCGYEKAEIIDEGIKYSDEDGVILLKCGNCEHSERLNEKTS